MKKILNFIEDYFIYFSIYAFIGWIYEVSWFLIVRHKFVNRGVLFGPFLPIYGFGILILLLFLTKFMKRKHYSSNMIISSISIGILVTFIYTTIIEYTTPRITSVTYYLQYYGLGLIIINLIGIILINFLIQKIKSLKNIDCTIILVFLIIWIITTLVEYVSHYYIDVYKHQLLWDYSKDFLNINRRVNWDASRNFALGGTFLLYTIQPLIVKILDKAKLKIKTIICLIIGIPILIDYILNVLL